MRFESKRDAWLVLLLLIVPLGLLAVIGAIWYRNHGELRGPIAGAIVLVIVEIALVPLLARSTYYAVDGGTLVIRSAFLTWRVPIANIRSITPTRSARSSPALSLDRLRIDYDGKQILVSPEDQGRFINSLRAINPSIVA